MAIENHTFLGIRPGSTLSFAAEALHATPVPFDAIELDPLHSFCAISDDRWAVQSGGLTLVFDKFPGREAVLTNWAYLGGPVGEYTEMVGRGVGVGDTRDALIAAYPEFSELGDEIVVEGGVRFLVDSDTVVRIGSVDCGD